MGEVKNSSASNTSISRWNPTKEQISILENLYKQGVRTPSAEQIQEITGTLREFGSIEGKNVFYWFQNHKARQRQKQKQQSFAYYTRLLQRSPQVLSPVTPLPRPNHAISTPVVCNNGVIYRPICMPPQAGGLNFYAQPQAQAQAQYSAMLFQESSKMIPVSNPEIEAERHETLELFPLHPANRRAEERSRSESSERAEEGEEEVGGEHQFLIDFLGALNG